jgi:hypothetical protein
MCPGEAKQREVIPIHQDRERVFIALPQGSNQPLFDCLRRRDVDTSGCGSGRIGHGSFQARECVLDTLQTRLCNYSRRPALQLEPFPNVTR